MRAWSLDPSAARVITERPRHQMLPGPGPVAWAHDVAAARGPGSRGPAPLLLRRSGQVQRAALDRVDITIESAFGGGGARDAFEMVTRAVTGGRFRYDADLAPDGPPSP